MVVTGANGFVGARVCAAFLEWSAWIRAVVRRGGSAPAEDGVEEWVGDFGDAAFAKRSCNRDQTGWVV
jgi:2-alkyl-3-oxoalkanoate reductase